MTRIIIMTTAMLLVVKGSMSSHRVIRTQETGAAEVADNNSSSNSRVAIRAKTEEIGV